MDIKEVKIELGKDWSGYQEVLISALSNDNVYVSKINNYLIENAGKQLRPVLSLLAARACGQVNTLNYNCAAVAEMIHTATLLHDDVADDGDLRRGVPTVKAIFGQASSVLAGDYWLARALSLLTECNPLILGCYTTAVQELAQGELIQMEKSQALDTTEADYYKIISGKTASLFVASTKSAALAVSAPADYVEAIENYAYELGLAFQIRDDIFDYTPSMDTGKIAGADIRERKITLPLLCAMKAAPEHEAVAVRKSMEGIEGTVIKGGVVPQKEQDIIASVNEFVQKYNGIAESQKILDEHSRRAIESLAVLPDSKAKERLVQLAKFVGTRSK